MRYEYKCESEECNCNEEIVIIDKPMAEVSRDEFCEKCKSKLKRVYSTCGIKTHDGYKS